MSQELLVQVQRFALIEFFKAQWTPEAAQAVDSTLTSAFVLPALICTGAQALPARPYSLHHGRLACYLAVLHRQERGDPICKDASIAFKTLQPGLSALSPSDVLPTYSEVKARSRLNER